MRDWKRLIDARDIWVLGGFILVFAGIWGKFDPYLAMIVIGGIVLVKGLTRWV